MHAGPRVPGISCPPALTAAVRPVHAPHTRGARAHHCVLDIPLCQHALEVIQNARVALATQSAEDEAPARPPLGPLDGPAPHFPHALVVVLFPREHPAIRVVPGMSSSSVCQGPVGTHDSSMSWQRVQWHRASGLVSTMPGAGYNACNRRAYKNHSRTARGSRQASSAYICCLSKAQPIFSVLGCQQRQALTRCPEASHG